MDLGLEGKVALVTAASEIREETGAEVDFRAADLRSARRTLRAFSVGQ